MVAQMTTSSIFITRLQQAGLGVVHVLLVSCEPLDPEELPVRLRPPPYNVTFPLQGKPLRCHPRFWVWKRIPLQLPIELRAWFSRPCGLSRQHCRESWRIPSGGFVGFGKHVRQREVLACRVAHQQLRPSRVTLPHWDYGWSSGRSFWPDHGSHRCLDPDHLEQVRDDSTMRCVLPSRHDQKSAAGFTQRACS